MLTTTIGTAASAWGLVMALAPILQIARMVRRRSSGDVSVGYFAVLVPGFLLWLGYGLVKNDLFLALPNALATLTSICLIVVALVLHHAEDDIPDAAPAPDEGSAVPFGSRLTFGINTGTAPDRRQRLDGHVRELARRSQVMTRSLRTWDGHETRRVTISDGRATLRCLRREGVTRPVARKGVQELGEILAEHTEQIVHHGAPSGARVLCVVILPGGAVLHPAFFARFRDADFCFLGMDRTGAGVTCSYATPIPEDRYDAVLYVDCVVGTGATIQAARTRVGTKLSSSEYLATLCSTRQGTSALIDAGLTIIGLALDEKLDAGLVLPGLGHLDAGDLFTQA
jgi:uracil phosphoribosyltransferase/uncharacterized protein with PQ loop repeat